MPLIQWSPDYSVNIKEIDEQHQRLIAMINDLHQSMLNGKSNQILQDLLQRLVDYTNVHFSYEEKLLETNNYPGYIYHKGEHAKFIKQVLDFQNRYQQNPTGLGIQIIEFLKSWLINHIQGTDKKYSKYLNNHGVF